METKNSCHGNTDPMAPPAKTSAWAERVSAMDASEYMLIGVLNCLFTRCAPDYIF